MQSCRAMLGMAAGVAVGCSQGSAAEPERPPDIVMVALDTVRWDRTSLSGHARDTTPNLAAFAELEGSVVFSQAYTDAAWSQPAYVSLFTGQHAQTHGVGFRTGKLPDGQATLAAMLQAAGYETRAWVSGPHLSPKTRIDRGFDAYEHSDGYRTLGAQVRPALAWLTADADQPRFAFVHGYDAHHPYATPALLSGLYRETAPPEPELCRGRYWRCVTPPLARAFGPELDDQLQSDLDSAYDAAVSFADHHLGRILHGLQEAGTLENTLVIVLSDHGEMLGEQGGVGHVHGHGDAVFHVPLVVHLPKQPDVSRPKQVDTPVVLSDLVPTLAARFGMSPPAGSEGVAIPALLDPPAPGAERMVRGASQCCLYVRDGDWTLLGVRHGDSYAWTLRRGRSPTDHSAEERDRLARMMDHLGDWPSLQDDTDQVSADLGRQSEALREALQEGGYWPAKGAKAP